jgi:hypothetical protein
MVDHAASSIDKEIEQLTTRHMLHLPCRGVKSLDIFEAVFIIANNLLITMAIWRGYMVTIPGIQPMDQQGPAF